MAKKLFSLLMALTLLAALALPAAFAEDYLDIINIADDNQSASYDLHRIPPSMAATCCAAR